MKYRLPTRLAAMLGAVLLTACGGSDAPEQRFDRVPPTLGETSVWRVSSSFNGGPPKVWSSEQRVVRVAANGYRIDTTRVAQLTSRDDFDPTDLLLRGGPAVYDTAGALDYLATCGYAYEPVPMPYPRSVGQTWTTRLRQTACYDPDYL